MTTTPTLIHIAMAITHTLIVIMVLDGGARVTGDMGDGVIMVIEVRVTGVMGTGLLWLSRSGYGSYGGRGYSGSRVRVTGVMVEEVVPGVRVTGLWWRRWFSGPGYGVMVEEVVLGVRLRGSGWISPIALFSVNCTVVFERKRKEGFPKIRAGLSVTLPSHSSD